MTDIPSGMSTWNWKKPYVMGLASIPTQWPAPMLLSGWLELTEAA